MKIEVIIAKLVKKNLKTKKNEFLLSKERKFYFFFFNYV